MLLSYQIGFFFLSNSSKESLFTLQFVSFAGVPLPSWGLDAEVFLLSGSSTTSSLEFFFFFLMFSLEFYIYIYFLNGDASHICWACIHGGFVGQPL